MWEGFTVKALEDAGADTGSALGRADYRLVWNFEKYFDTDPDGWCLQRFGNTTKPRRCGSITGTSTPAELFELAEKLIRVHAPDARIVAATVTVLGVTPGPFGEPSAELDVVELWATETTTTGAAARAAAQLPILTRADEFFRGARYRRHARDAAQLAGLEQDESQEHTQLATHQRGARKKPGACASAPTPHTDNADSVPVPGFENPVPEAVEPLHTRPTIHGGI